MQQLINGVALGGTFALLGVGLTLIWGVMGVLTFAQAQVLTWGGFGTLVAWELGASVWVAFGAGVLTGAVVCVLVEVTVIGPLRRRGGSEFSFVAATMGVSVLLGFFLEWRTHAQTLTFPREGFPTGSMRIGALTLSELQVAIIVITILVSAALMATLRWTRFGRDVRAVAESREVASLLGVSPRATYWVVSAIAGALAAIAGIFQGVSNANISYSSGDHLLMIAFAVAVVGGIGSVGGAVVGGLAIGIVQVFAVAYVSSAFQQAAAFLAILIVLVLRPQGLFGREETVRV